MWYHISDRTIFLKLGQEVPLEGVASRLEMVDEGVVELGDPVSEVGDVVPVASTAGEVAVSFFDLVPTTAPPTAAPTIANNSIAPKRHANLKLIPHTRRLPSPGSLFDPLKLGVTVGYSVLPARS